MVPLSKNILTVLVCVHEPSDTPCTQNYKRGVPRNPRNPLDPPLTCQQTSDSAIIIKREQANLWRDFLYYIFVNRTSSTRFFLSEKHFKFLHRKFLNASINSRKGPTTLSAMDWSREDALRRRRERERERRASETSEQREARVSRQRLRDRERARQRLATETGEEREARLTRSRVRARARRAAESEEMQQARLQQLSDKANCRRVQRGERGSPSATMQKSTAENCH